MEPVDYTSDPLLDEEVDLALAKNDPALIWRMTATLATMEEPEYQIHRSAIKKRMNGSLSVTALDAAVRAAREPEEEEDPENPKIPPNKVANAILEVGDLLNVRGNYYLYDGRKWSINEESIVHQKALSADGEHNTTHRRRQEIASFLKETEVCTDPHVGGANFCDQAHCQSYDFPGWLSSMSWVAAECARATGWFTIQQFREKLYHVFA